MIPWSQDDLLILEVGFRPNYSGRSRPYSSRKKYNNDKKEKISESSVLDIENNYYNRPHDFSDRPQSSATDKHQSYASDKHQSYASDKYQSCTTNKHQSCAFDKHQSFVADKHQSSAADRPQKRGQKEQYYR